MTEVAGRIEIADSESLSVVSDRNGYEPIWAVRKVSLFESFSVVRRSEPVTNSWKRHPLCGLPSVDDGPATISLSEVRYRRRLGGLLKSYSRVAA